MPGATATVGSAAEASKAMASSAGADFLDIANSSDTTYSLTSGGCRAQQRFDGRADEKLELLERHAARRQVVRRNAVDHGHHRVQQAADIDQRVDLAAHHCV